MALCNQSVLQVSWDQRGRRNFTALTEILWIPAGKQGEEAGFTLQAITRLVCLLNRASYCDVVDLTTCCGL